VKNLGNSKVIALLMIAGLVAGCAPKNSTEATRDPGLWFIESYDVGTITVKYDGKTYKARCDGHRILAPDQFVWDAVPSFPCHMAMDEVGAQIQPITLDSDFHRPVLFMGLARGSLTLRRQDTIETFTIASITDAH
jgi:hypothetical protein